jgi:AraC family transcriptional regulator of adaptative response / DNA-3-methyladenine glycosylase II
MNTDLLLDRDALERVRMSRDPRFDGKFFIGVKTTGIYCRPICPTPHAKRHNVLYFATGAAAAEAGFRPCLRCRPEAAPGTSAWLGTSAVVRRALRLIHDGALDEVLVDQLAAQLGIGARHLNRLFVQHVGASPLAVAQTRRLGFAKRLLDETTLPITEIALASGFGSVRRFNDAMLKTYQRSPRELRQKDERERTSGDEVVLRLAFRPPYDWARLAEDLFARAIPGVERIDARGYARTIAGEHGHAIVRVRPLDRQNALELRIAGAAPASLFQLSSAARRVFDLAADPALIVAAFAGDALMKPLVRARPGLRIAGAWNPFECAVAALVGSTRLRRLVDEWGLPVSTGERGLTHLFPTPAALASANFDRVGLPRAKATALRNLATQVADGALDFAAAPEEVLAALGAPAELDEAFVEHVALRALGEPDAFPLADPTLRARAEAWRPWRGYAAVHLLLSARGRRRARLRS